MRKWSLLLVCALPLTAAWLLKCKTVELDTQDPAVKIAPQDTGTSRFTCAGKTSCSQMESCREAEYYLEHCPGVGVDGDADGIPCEEQWCGGLR